MSSNAPQSQDDPWVPKRVHGGLRHVRKVGRGKKRHYEFQGQEAGEEVKLVLRKHKFFLIAPALPLVGTIIALIAILTLDINFSQAGPLWAFLALIFGVLFLVTGAYFIYKDFLLWWIETTIITNKRIMIWKGYLNPTRESIPLLNVVQVAVDQESLLSILLSYGDVHLYLVGGKGAAINKIPNPKRVRDSFQKISYEAKQSKKPEEPHPEPENPDLRQVLAKLAQNDPLPYLPDPDAKYADRQRPDRPRSPLRTFGGPLRLPNDVRYTSDEHTVMYIQRSKYVLVGKLILPILVLLGVIVVTLYVPSIFVYASIGILAILLWIGVTIINYVDDVYILTNKRIIDIERRLVILNEQHDIAEYGQIKEIKVDVGNPIFLLLDVGTVIVQTPGDNPNITLSVIDHPFSIQDMLIALKGHKEKVEKVQAANKLKNDLNKWFGTVLDTMERKVLGRGVPNLQKLDLWTAAQRASALGMLVVPVGEDTSYPNIDPGTIVDQDPQPGTLIQFNPDDREERPKIRVTLSARP